MGSLFANPAVMAVGLILLGLILVLVCVLSTWKKVPTDKGAVIVGLGEPKVVTGGGTMVIPLLQRMDVITLENVMFDVNISQIKTSLGVPVDADGVVVIKVRNDQESIKNAIQQFNCSSEKATIETIKNQASEVCKGKLREIVSSMSIEAIYDNREEFASKVQEVVGTELSLMGLELKSFTINDIRDNEGYIEALGKEQIAKVKSNAEIAEAEATKEKQIKTAEARKIGRTAELKAETEIKQAEKDKELRVLEYKKETDSEKAKVDVAYSIQQNIIAKEVTNTEKDASILEEQRNRELEEARIQVEIAKEEKNIELAKRQAEKEEAKLLAEVVKKAEAEKLRRQLESDANKYDDVKKAEAVAEKTVIQGKANAQAIEIEGKARAEAIRLKGLAEAEALEKKAEALAKMNDAGKIELVVNKLPEIAKAVAEPLSKIGNITIIGGSGEGGGDGVTDVSRYTVGALNSVNEALKSTLGFDLTEVMKSQTITAKTTRNVNLELGDSPIPVTVSENTVKVEEKDVKVEDKVKKVVSDTKKIVDDTKKVVDGAKKVVDNNKKTPDKKDK